MERSETEQEMSDGDLCQHESVKFVKVLGFEDEAREGIRDGGKDE